jgi:DNA repair protein SbcD/Mre11
MRFLHTSDWHLGKGLKGHDLSEAQEAALDEIITLAEERQVEAFVIAGDVFDRAFPSVEDVRRLNAALTRIHRAGIPIICTAGNHDEGARLAAYMNLLDERVTVVGEYGQVGTAVELRDDHGPVVFYPLPYLDPDGARRALAPTGGALLERSHEAVVAEAMRRVRDDLAVRQQSEPTTRAVVVSHAFVVRGSETPEELRDEQSESERDIAVGGVPSVPTGVYRGVHYVALGHLHGPRTVQEADPMIRYSGSILRYSISEAAHAKSVTVVNLDAEGACTVEVIPVTQPAGMVRLRGELDDLVSGAYSQHRDDFVDILLTDRRLPDNYLAQLHDAFTRILSALPDRSVRAGGDGERAAASPLQATSQLDTLRNFYVTARGEEPTAQMDRILADALERARMSVEA